MIDAFGFLGLLLLLLSGNKGGGASSSSRPPAPRPPPMLPPGGGLVTSWPQAQPAAGLPPFPGSGWEYDEPPPPAVKQRAAQLVSVLVKKGIGTKQIEQTEGRWIAYRVEKMRSGKNGIVAYRVKQSASAPAPRATAPAPASPASPAAALPASPAPYGILTATSPGLPVPSVGARVVQVVAGRHYQWTLLIDTTASIAAEEIARGIAAAGGVDISVSKGPPFVVSYVQRAVASHLVTLNKPIVLSVKVGNTTATATVTVVEGKEVLPKAAPPVTASTPAPSPAAVPVATAAPAPAINPLAMPDLKYGMGLKPAAPNENVRVVQVRLGVTPADGRFGGDTQDAVINFQKSTGLAPNLPLADLKKRGFGAVKQATWVKLFAVRA